MRVAWSFLGVVLVILSAAGCDLHPPRERASGSASGSPPAPPTAPVDAATAMLPPARQPTVDKASEPTQACLDVGLRVADMLIENESDPQKKAGLQQEKTRTVQLVAAACTSQRWSDEARACYLKLTKPAEMAGCAKLLRPAP